MKVEMYEAGRSMTGRFEADDDEFVITMMIDDDIGDILLVVEVVVWQREYKFM